MPGWAEDSVLELKYGVRALRKAPAFAVLMVLTLALGVGTNGAVYSVLDRLFVGAPDGVPSSALVKRLHQQFKSPVSSDVSTRDAFSYPEFEAVSRRLRQNATAAYVTLKVTLGRSPDMYDGLVEYVIGDYFGILRTTPAAGRLLRPREIDAGTQAAVISHDLWINRFGRTPLTQGLKIAVGGHDFVVLGVTQEGFRGVGLNAAQVWVPFVAHGNPRNWPGTTSNRYDMLAAILVRARAPSELPSIKASVDQALREVNTTFDTSASATLASLAQKLDPMRGASAIPTVAALAAAGGVILVIACINATILILVRAARRGTATAIRFALGITRARILTQIAVETLLFFALASAVGLITTAWSGAILRNGLVPRIEWGSSPVNYRVIEMVLGLGLLASLAAACVPAWIALASNTWGSLSASRGAKALFSTKLRARLLATQSMLAIVLLAGGAVFIQTLRNVMGVPTGYSADDVVIASLPPHFGRAQSELNAASRLFDVEATLKEAPGVDATALTIAIPVLSINFAPMFLPGRDSLPQLSGGSASVSVISPGFLKTFGIRLIQGRAFTDADRPGNEPVVIATRLAARVFWPGEDALGKCLIIFKKDGPCRVVVGIADDISTEKFMEPPRVRFFVPLAQAPSSYGVPRALA